MTHSNTLKIVLDKNSIYLYPRYRYMKTTDSKTKKLIALKKASSLINKITQMVADDNYCIDIMQQNLAAIGLLRSFQQLMFEKHLNSCFLSGMQSKNLKRKQQIINEILTVTNLSNK